MLYDIEQIKQIIPHRDPMLMVDCIEQLDQEAGTVVGPVRNTSERPDTLHPGIKSSSAARCCRVTRLP